MRFDKVALLGVGLLGGSLGLALKRKQYARRVCGFVRRPEAVSSCVACGAVDEATLDLEPVVRDADLVVLATPVSEMPGLARRMAPWLRPGALVTDVGSVKAVLVTELEPVIGRAGAHFIGSHPMAGSEKSGVDHASADLFGHSVCIVTPTATSAPAALSVVTELWHAVGARTLLLSPELHDELVSRSSHLPHVIAAQLAHYVLDPRHSEHQALLCASGFRDSTRIASGSPQMWRDITLANREYVQQALEAFIRELGQFRDLVAGADAPGVQKFFESAKARRDRWTASVDGTGARADE